MDTVSVHACREHSTQDDGTRGSSEGKAHSRCQLSPSSASHPGQHSTWAAATAALPRGAPPAAAAVPRGRDGGAHKLSGNIWPEERDWASELPTEDADGSTG